MELTNDKIEELGFKRINNSMWRCGDVTLQNGWKSTGMWTVTKAYKVCVNGKYNSMITDVLELAVIIATPETKGK